MFKPQVLRRNFSLFNRVPYSRIVRSAARDGHETFTIQRVHIRKPFLSKSRLVGAVAIAGATYGLGRYLGLEVEIEEVEEEQQKSTRSIDQVSGDDEHYQPAEDFNNEEESDDEYDDALIFLPTGFSRPRPRTYYKGSDPEWKEFRKLALDRPRVEKIRGIAHAATGGITSTNGCVGQLVGMIRDLVAKDPKNVLMLGKIDKSKGKVWIEFQFPDGPPLEYERPGIELTEDLEWRKATRPVEDIHHIHLKRLLFPTEAATALYQDTKRKAELIWRGFKAYIGWEEKYEPETVQQLVQRIGASPSSTSPPAKPMKPAVPNPSPVTPATDTQQPSVSPSVAPADGPAKDVGFVLPDPKKLTLDLSQFRQDFRKSFGQLPMQVPRGSVIVRGLIEVYGERARLTLNVVAVYDPKSGRYTGVRAHLFNHLIPHRQHPKGGP
ncbi:hypothetical protein N0V83_003994 [Neocucurbitaria cava]|uniref:Uncharacterized protein n=1 Tax=Neocucurbitaria cava TaxID=798079 RepID=A0A9W9CNU6_9PLEO|nr:hypothetical protein N0V83_003994 [Neocucurbitaria cava]